jgi:hypothetical protein
LQERRRETQVISIVLVHNHYDADHLETVKTQMLELGAPKIRCFFDEANDLWFAVEGCHRLRAAHELGLTPIVEDISDDDSLAYQVDGEDVTVELDTDFFEAWYDRNGRNVILDFEEDETDD